MGERISEWLHRVSTGWVALAALVIFLYLENLSTSLVMLRYPDHTPVVDALAPIFTLVKWIFVGGSFVLLFIGLAVGAWRWIRTRSFDLRAWK